MSQALKSVNCKHWTGSKGIYGAIVREREKEEVRVKVKSGSMRGVEKCREGRKVVKAGI